MNAEALLVDLSGRGIRLTPDGDELVVEPASKLTDADRDLIRQYKPALLPVLAAQELTTLPQSPAILEAIADAIAARPRSPIENDFALSRIAPVALEAGRIVRTLPNAARREALSLCTERSQQASESILQRNYERAYLILDTLPEALASFRPQ